MNQLFIILLLGLLPFGKMLADQELRLMVTYTEKYEYNKDAKRFEFKKLNKVFDSSETFILSDSTLYLVTQNSNIELRTIKNDEKVLVAMQDVEFHGSRTYTFFKKTRRLVKNETSWSLAQEIDPKSKITESISTMFGTY
ncbi:hypothetical protein EHR10_08755 [Leptospira yasudae]|nr:hypothetical protein EHR10_08755 [Leptospira yasudae]